MLSFRYQRYKRKVSNRGSLYTCINEHITTLSFSCLSLSCKFLFENYWNWVSSGSHPSSKSFFKVSINMLYDCLQNEFCPRTTMISPKYCNQKTNQCHSNIKTMIFSNVRKVKHCFVRTILKTVYSLGAISQKNLHYICGIQERFRLAEFVRSYTPPLFQVPHFPILTKW